MEIGVTQTIQKRLKNQDIHQPYEQTTELAFCWDTHLVKLGRRNVLLIANVSNRFMIAMMDIEPRNWKYYTLYIDEVISNAMKQIGYQEKEIKKYFELAGNIQITKSHGRKTLGAINYITQIMNCYEWNIDRYHKYSYELNDCVNNNLCIPEGFHEYGMPIEMFHMDMERLGIKKANRIHNVISFEDRKRTYQENKEENVEIKSLKESKKVLILSASPRRKGNSQILCDKFAEGAKSAGHQVKMIRLSDKKINFCKACDACMKNEGLCIQRDDMGDILKAYQQADILVLATPVYFYGISAQMKTFIDRTYPIWQNLGHKNVYYIISAGLGEDIINRSLGDLDGFVEHLDDSKVKGRIYATNVMDAGLVKEQEDLLERAYEMGKSIFNVSANL